MGEFLFDIAAFTLRNDPQKQCNNTNKTFKEWALAIKLWKLQNQEARILTFASYSADTKIIIERIGWKKLEKLFKTRFSIRILFVFDLTITVL